MKNTFGNSVSITLFGESHGDAIGVVLDGIAPGITIDGDFIAHQLFLRRPQGRISTARQEQDSFQIVSGVFNKITTGAPICILLPNKDIKSADYEDVRFLPRPGHADLTAHIKYHGYEDYRGGGHFSGRLTAPLVAAGAIVISALREKGIAIGTHIKNCAGIQDHAFSDLKNEITLLNESPFPVICEEAGEKMKTAIEAAALEKDSVGGVLETAVIGLPAGVGEPWFDSLESVLSHGLFSIPAIKGVEFGAGFGASRLRGSENNDAFRVEDGRIVTETNRAGGILGGITTGMPLTLRVGIKPTPSIGRPQKTVSLARMENTELTIRGRHDPCIAHRAVPVVEAVTACVLLDLLLEEHHGTF